MFLVLKTTGMVLLTILAGICLSGAMYFWTDKEGFKHFSNISPPKNSPVQLLDEKKRVIPKGHEFKVVKIFDGDTIRVAGFGLQFTIRLVGIDTPEIGRNGAKDQPYGQQAKQKLALLINQKSISLKQYGTGGYNRVLAEVFVGATNVNLEMVRSGFAQVYRGNRPNQFNAKPYFQAEQQARRFQEGILGQGDAYKSPRQWRREHPAK